MPTLPYPATTLHPASEMARAVRALLPDFGAVHWCTETGSTNTDLLAWVRDHNRDYNRDHNRRGDTALPAARLLGAHWQSAGRGRAGRTLINQPGDMLMFSCAFALRIEPTWLPSLSLVTGLAACEVLRRHAQPERAARLALKWPNDFQFDDAKLAGLMVETLRLRAAGPDVYGIVVGMGTNLRHGTALTAQLQRPVADWSQVAGTTPLPELAAAIARAWQAALPLCAREGFGAFAARFRALDALAGRVVNVIDQGRVVASGVARGVDDTGRLLVAEGATTHAVSVGDVSVRAQSGLLPS